jgi:hypothetical protein
MYSAIKAIVQPDYYVISYVVLCVIGAVIDLHQASCDGFALTVSVGLCSPQNWDHVHPHSPPSSSSSCVH